MTFVRRAICDICGKYFLGGYIFCITETGRIHRVIEDKVEGEIRNHKIFKHICTNCTEAIFKAAGIGEEDEDC